MIVIQIILDIVLIIFVICLAWFLIKTAPSLWSDWKEHLNERSPASREEKQQHFLEFALIWYSDYFSGNNQ